MRRQSETTGVVHSAVGGTDDADDVDGLKSTVCRHKSYVGLDVKKWYFT
jgi:hypothetical protein